MNLLTYSKMALSHNLVILMARIMLDLYIVKEWLAQKLYTASGKGDAGKYHMQQFVKGMSKYNIAEPLYPMYFMAIEMLLIVDYKNLRRAADFTHPELVFHPSFSNVFTTSAFILETVSQVNRIKTGADFFKLFCQITKISAHTVRHRLGSQFYEELSKHTMGDAYNLLIERNKSQKEAGAK